MLYKAFLESNRVVIDSRKLAKGDFFVALKGERTDGNKYVSDALKKGAKGVITDNPDAAPGNKKCFVVKDSLKALQKLATMHRKKLDVPVFAITGSNGKTTTRVLIEKVLAEKYNVKATKGNLNNHIGVPLTILTFNKHTEVGIVEMGANHKGEIAALCKIARPDYGLITNIGKAHLEGFGSLEGVKEGKSELFRYLEEHKGTVFINSDNEILMDCLGEQEVVAYGEGDNTHFKGLIAETIPALVVRWRPNNPLGFMNDDWSEQSRLIHTNLSGVYNFENIMAAIAVGADFGVPEQSIKKAIEGYVPSDNRSQWVKKENNTLLLDAYNANPTSMNAAISNFSRMQGNRKVMILGDMLEMGDYAEAEHEELVRRLMKEDFKEVFFVGKHFAKYAETYGYRSFNNTDELISYLKDHPVRNALILVKGSRGIALEKVQEVL